MRHLTCGLLAALILLMTFLGTATGQSRTYDQIIKQKFDKKDMRLTEQTQTFKTGIISLKDKELSVDTVKYIIIQESPLQIKKDYIFKHVLLAPVQSTNHRTYDCILSYKNTNGTIKNDLQSGLYAIEFWKSDLTCYYYLLTVKI